MAGAMDLSRNFPNADIESIRLIGFGEYNVVEASPITHVTVDDPSFLLIHGDLDELVPYEQSQLMYDKLVQMNVPAQLVIVTNATHSLAPMETPRQRWLSSIKSFLIFWQSIYNNCSGMGED